MPSKKERKARGTGNHEVPRGKMEEVNYLKTILLPNWTLIPILTLLPNFGGFHRTLQRVRLANRGRLLLRTPGPVPFGICSNVETILSRTCHIYNKAIKYKT